MNYSFNIMFIYKLCSSLSREGRYQRLPAVMASFYSISSFGHCSLERCEEGSEDMLEHRYIILVHEIGFSIFQVAQRAKEQMHRKIE